MNFSPDIKSHDVSYVTFDLETTGLSPNQDAIIEIGAQAIQKGQLVGHFQTLVNPLQPISAQASAVNNIKDEDVADAPTLPEVLPDFLRFIDGSVLVAHNASFDSRFLSAALKKNQIADLSNYVLDTLTLSHKIFPEYRDHSLKAIADRFQLVNKQSHRAFEDAEVTAKILLEFLTALALKGHHTFRQVAQVHGVPLGRITGSPKGQSVKGYLENMSSSLF